MDNASFHKKSEIERIARLYKCRVVWLPPYSPDKNKIEKLWANMQNWLHINAQNFLLFKMLSWLILNWNSYKNHEKKIVDTLNRLNFSINFKSYY